MKILMCTDGSKQAEDAIKFGYQIAKALGADVTLLGVIERAEDEKNVEESLPRANEMLAGVNIRTKIARGYADEEIVKEETGYDLVVMGSIGRRGIARFLLGPTAGRVIRYSRTSVLIVRGAPGQISKILICTGGGEKGEEDIKFGGRIAKALGAEATILHCKSQIPMIDVEEREMRAVSTSLEEDTREAVHLKKGLGILEDEGVKASAKLRYGLVEDEIFSELREGKYDLLVIGAHASVGLSKYLLGDITSRVVEHAEAPVLVVRTPKHVA